jgi:hypothetical protein
LFLALGRSTFTQGVVALAGNTPLMPALSVDADFPLGDFQEKSGRITEDGKQS